MQCIPKEIFIFLGVSSQSCDIVIRKLMYVCVYFEKLILATFSKNGRIDFKILKPIRCNSNRTCVDSIDLYNYPKRAKDFVSPKILN